ncbi:TPA: hypothetical protein ACQJMR_004091 [Raoultella ornithinolytica]
MTTDITELAHLRAELSNPAVGSKDHLRKLALSLVEALELKEQQRANWFQVAQKLADDLDAAEKRIAELESPTVTVKLPQRLQPGADGWDDWYVHSDDEGEYLKFDDVLAMLTAAGIKWEAE